MSLDYEADHPDHPGDLGYTPAKKVGEKIKGFGRYLCTKQCWLGEYDYAYLFTPSIPFIKRSRKATPFFGLNDSLPIVLALVLGFQHALSMLAGVITPAIILGGDAGVALAGDQSQYLVSAALITTGLLSMIQITRFHIYKTQYYIGTGLISVVGTSFATIPVATGSFAQMYKNGTCQFAEDGSKLPCPDGYGMLIATTCICGLFEVLLSFLPIKLLRKMFPPIVTGPTVLLIGISLIGSGFEDWAGGSGDCMSRPTTGDYQLCPSNDAPMAAPWGSAQFIGLGFSVFVTIILCEKWGAPIMKSCAVIVGLLVGCIIGSACGYFSPADVINAPAATFVWVHTFNLKLYGPAVLPMIAVYLVLAMEAIGDITATCDVSRLEVDGAMFDSRIQGGVLADGINGILAGLFTLPPMSTFAQNNGVISLTKCANRTAGYFCCFFLIIMGVFSKFAGALLAIPAPIMGGMTTFLFTSVAVSGLRICATVPFTRRNRFIMTAGLAVGFGATLVPDWFSYFFTYEGNNGGLSGLLSAVELVMETGFSVTAFMSVILNLFIDDEPDEIEVDAADPPATHIDSVELEEIKPDPESKLS